MIIRSGFMVDSLVVDRALITEAEEGNGGQSRTRGHGTRVKKANIPPPPPPLIFSSSETFWCVNKFQD